MIHNCTLTSPINTNDDDIRLKNQTCLLSVCCILGKALHPHATSSAFVLKTKPNFFGICFDLVIRDFFIIQTNNQKITSENNLVFKILAGCRDRRNQLTGAYATESSDSAARDLLACANLRLIFYIWVYRDTPV